LICRYKTIGAIPVFFNSVFQIFIFFCLFLSQTVDEPFICCDCGTEFDEPQTVIDY